MGSQARNRERYFKHRAWIDAYKLEHGCADCGYNAYAEALDFDHRDQATKCSAVSQIILKALPVLKAEVEKCDVVCANCHRVRTRLGLKNGTIINPRHHPESVVREPGNEELLRLPI